MNSKTRNIVIAVILIIAAMVLLTKICSNHSAKDEIPEEFAAGITRIQSLEAQDPNEVDAVVKDYRRQVLLEQHDELMAKMESGEVSVWSLLQDYVILGDSRGAGFKFIRQLDEERNLAVYGNTADKIPEYYEQIAKFNPTYILLFFGINDSLRSECYEIDDFIAYYTDKIEDLQEQFPEAKIFVNPIFPCIDDGLARYKQWERTAEYDQAVREVAKLTDTFYVNCDDIEMKDEYYKDDGLHFWNDFMEIWMKHIVLTIYDSELGLTNFDSADDVQTTTDTSASTSSEVSVDTKV